MWVVIYVIIWFSLLGFSFLLAQEEARTSVKREGNPRQVVSLVRGRVIDAVSGVPLPGVRLTLGAKGAFTDAKGEFSLPFTQSGDTLWVQLSGYRTKGVRLAGLAELTIALEEFSSEVEAVEIVAEAGRETEASVVVERLRSLELGEVYTAQRIMRMTTDFYGPMTLRRIPGVSLLSGRFITLRGLGERYNAIAFYGAYPLWLRYDGKMPVVDQLITTLLGRIEIRKFWTPELIGHFGGGVIDLQLPEGTGEEGLFVSYTAEAALWSVGRPSAYVKSPWRYPVSKDFPPSEAVISSYNQGQLLPQNFTYAQQYQPLILPDTLRFTPLGGLLTLGWQKQVGNWRFYWRGAATQRFLVSKYDYVDGEFVYDTIENQPYFERYLWLLAPNLVEERSNSLSFVGGVSWNPRAGEEFQLVTFGLSSNYQRFSLERSYYFNVYISPTDPLGVWYPTYYLEQDQLGLVRLRWCRRLAENLQVGWESGLVWQQLRLPFSGAMNYVKYPADNHFSYELELWEEYAAYAHSYHGASQGWQVYAHPYVEKRWGSSMRWLSVRIGGWLLQERQGSQARIIGFLPDTSRPWVLDSTILWLENIRQVYQSDHLQPGGFGLSELTTDYHTWRSNTQMAAGYLTMRFGLGQRWEGLAGFRYEYWVRRIRNRPLSATDYQSLFTESTTDILPALLLKYQTGERSQVRLGVTQTLLRPLAPAQVPAPYFDHLYAYFWMGDTTYRTGHGWNLDIRYDWLGSAWRSWAIGVFYKALQNLPEMYLIPESYSVVFSYAMRNRSRGEILGLELEGRELLWGAEDQPKLSMGLSPLAGRGFV